MKTTIRILLAVIVLTAAAIGAVYSGLYDFAADVPHARVVERLIETARERSIERRAADIRVPDLNDPARIAEGAEHYAEMCTGCHLAPGMQDTEIRKGLYPQPPNLVVDGVDDPAEAFWVIKHGIKMTAMPAWGATHDDEKIWGMVAFLGRLPKLSPTDYAQLTASAAAAEHEHEHEHEHDEK